MLRLLLLAPLALLTACSQPQSKETGAKVPVENWQYRMQQFSQSLSKLLPYVHSQQKFNDKDNYYLIKKEVERLKGVTHAISKQKPSSDLDPGVRYVSREFSRELDHAYKNLISGKRTKARRQLKDMTTYCISCHTRTDKGMQNIFLDLNADLTAFAPLEKADYFTAVRQFDAALNAYDQALTDKTLAQRNSSEWLRATKRSLAIAIRVKKDPNLALELISRLFDARSVPKAYKQDAFIWRQSVKAWRKEVVSKRRRTTSYRMNKARILFQKGWEKGHFPWANTGFIDFVRASALVHEILAEAKTSKKTYTQALYYAGLLSEAMGDMQLSGLHESYYEGCIQNWPRSELAQKCFLRFEAIQYDKYQDDIPDHVMQRLKDLQTMSGEFSF